jgi:hypothetical protein
MNEKFSKKGVGLFGNDLAMIGKGGTFYHCQPLPFVPPL